MIFYPTAGSKTKETYLHGGAARLLFSYRQAYQSGLHMQSELQFMYSWCNVVQKELEVVENGQHLGVSLGKHYDSCCVRCI